MSSYTNHIKEDDEFYRGVIAYEKTPHARMPNPKFDPNKPENWMNQRQHYAPTGAPDETIIDMIGPYTSTSPIKSYITRNRGRNQYKNLRLVRIEKVSGWEEVGA